MELLSIVKIGNIRPPKHRIREDIGDLTELKQSITEKGIIEPIIVRTAGEKFEIIAGYRRYMSAVELGLPDVPISIVEADDGRAFEIALIENLMRKTMDPLEEANAYHRYVTEFGYGSQTELAKKIGKTPQYINHWMSLITLPEETRASIKAGNITASHGEAMSNLDADDAEKLTRMITAPIGKPFLDVDQTRKAVAYMRRGLDAEQAVETVTNHPEWQVSAKEHVKFDPIKMARETMSLDLQKLLVNLDNNINRLPEGEERVKWTTEIRYPVHQLYDHSLKLLKVYGKKNE
jgi:ParB/RepB/Spo0J family partition protein